MVASGGQTLLTREWPWGKACGKERVGTERDEKEEAYAWFRAAGQHTTLPVSDI